MRFFNLHTHKSAANPEILELVNQYPWEFDEGISRYSIGIHPWHIDQDRIEADLMVIAEKLYDANCLALGECGLDKRIEIPIEVQLPVFEKQLLLAEKHRKPVVLHCVAAYKEAIDTKKKLGITVPMIIHGFSKNSQVAKQLLDNGFYLSFGKYLLRNPELEQVFTTVPDDRFFLETDMIEETIQDVYALAAKHRKIEIEELKELVGRSFTAVFGNSEKL